ncbi:MAG TPA: glycoside hydrolase family 19 protein [Gemmatimonadaceae bacterium]|nr:glycoside hydrolase family 19 protein [Gemmatimonadaceae bacterium]
MTFDLAILDRLAPHAKAAALEAFAHPRVLEASGLLVYPVRLAHFLAQVLHETAGLTALVENLNYRAERIRVVWPNRFPTAADAEPFSRNPVGLANKVYGRRMGNTGPNDGWRYIGRGLLPITGRGNYTRVGAALGIDLVGHPYLAASDQHMLAIACEIWRTFGCHVYADADDLSKVTRAINGGTIGLAERRTWLGKTKAALGVMA